MKTEAEILEIKGLKVVEINSLGGSGFIKILGTLCSVIWTYPDEHVSISPMKMCHIPTWNEMCELKDMFYYDDEEAYQIHPKKSEYVNLAKNCLHLWGKV